MIGDFAKTLEGEIVEQKGNFVWQSRALVSIDSKPILTNETPLENP